MLDRFADFVNRAHPGNLVLTRPDMKSKEKARLSPKFERRRMNQAAFETRSLPTLFEKLEVRRVKEEL